MRISRLYIDGLLETGTTFKLKPEQVHYLTSVLRLRAGNQVYLFNNQDTEYLAKITELNKKTASLLIESEQRCKRESTLQTTLGIGISRGQHMDYAIQKAVELGVNVIAPLMTEFSNVKISENRLDNKLQHWQQIIIHATEQCGRTQLAELLNPQDIKTFIESNQNGLKLIFHPEADVTIKDIHKNEKGINLLLGPEGGFSDVEIEFATKHNYQLISLGPRVLRAETAVVAALTACQTTWGDLA